MCERGSVSIITSRPPRGCARTYMRCSNSITKAALIMMTHSYALNRPKGVRVNAIAPGLIQTALSE